MKLLTLTFPTKLFVGLVFFVSLSLSLSDMAFVLSVLQCCDNLLALALQSGSYRQAHKTVQVCQSRGGTLPKAQGRKMSSVQIWEWPFSTTSFSLEAEFSHLRWWSTYVQKYRTISQKWLIFDHPRKKHFCELWCFPSLSSKWVFGEKSPWNPTKHGFREGVGMQRPFFPKVAGQTTWILIVSGIGAANPPKRDT